MYKSALKHSTELPNKEFRKAKKVITLWYCEHTVRKWLVHDGKSIH